MQDPLDGYPKRVAEALRNLLSDLKPLAPEPVALVVYGSLARGTYDPEKSDVNLAVVLERADSSALQALHVPLRTAWRAVRVEPFLVRLSEIDRLADTFPIKLLDIKRHSHAILGDNPFQSVEVQRRDLRLRTEQELRNHLLRLRRRYAMNHGNAPALGDALQNSVGALVIELSALLELHGKVPEDPGHAEVLKAAAQEFGFEASLLERLYQTRHGGVLGREIEELYQATLELVARAVDVADRLEVQD